MQVILFIYLFLTKSGIAKENINPLLFVEIKIVLIMK